ncbi:hypothetical protein BV20DRAFT_963240 [Pilatotrama ljubarskyi]|nr:hypothetical protein BV20DRAFT_963240 [Pilatotrama ljubarskyi]
MDAVTPSMNLRPSSDYVNWLVLSAKGHGGPARSGFTMRARVRVGSVIATHREVEAAP